MIYVVVALHVKERLSVDGDVVGAGNKVKDLIDRLACSRNRESERERRYVRFKVAHIADFECA